MAIIYSYPTVTPSLNDLVLGTDVDNTGKATRNFTVQSIIDLVTVTGNNLQDVLNNGNIAVGRDIILGTVQDPAQTIYAGTFSTGVASIVGGVGQNFTDFTSTRITGTLQTNAQPNITSLGTLTSLKIGNATPAITSIVTTLTAPGDDIKLATTKAIVDYIATTPNPETLAQTLIAGQVTGGRDIIVSAGDDVTFTDTSKIILGTGSDATIEHDGTDLKIVNTDGKTTISNSSGDIDISATAATKKLNLNGKTGVELQFDTGKRLETLLGGAKVTGAFEATGIGTLNGIVNTNSYTDSSGDTGTSGQILSSTGASGTNWIDDPNPTPYSWLVETDSGTGSPYTVVNGNQIHFKGDTNISTSWNNTNKEVLISLSGTSVIGTGAANQVTYWDGTQTITGAAGFTFAGGATGKVTVAGQLEIGTLTDGNFIGISGTYTGYQSISSAVFVGPLQGNADTATALAAAGTVSMSGDTVAAGVTYTSGGNVPLVSTISDSVVYNKELAGFNATSGSVADGDSIIEALEKLQGQITNLPQGLVYQGVWSAAGTGGGTPDLTQGSYKVNGHFYICDTAGSAAPNGAGTTPNDWDVRDWVIFADDGAGGGVDEWQKIDNSSLAGGTGTPNTMTKWLTNQTIGNSTITDNGSIVTIADTIDFTTQGNNTFGNTSADTTLMKGNTTLEQNLILAKGLSLGSSYGSAGQVLTSGGGVNVANTWTTPTTGTVTSVGLTETGDALTITNSPITSSGDINIAGAGASTQYINGELNLITFPTLDNYQYWTLSDGTNTTNITTTGTVTFASGAGIINTEASGTITTAIDYVGTNNAVLQAGVATPVAADQLWFSDGSDNTIKRASISDIVDLGNETLAQVLVNGNTSGANDIVMADSQKITFGTAPDLQLYHDTSNSYIETTSGSAGDLYIKSQGTGHDLYLQATDDVFIRPQGGQDGIKVIGNYGVELYGYNLGTSAMNKAFYIAELGNGFVRPVAEKGLRISNGSDAYGLFNYSTQGTGNNRGGILMYGGNQGYGKRIFIGTGYIQGTTSSSPGFGLNSVVEFFPTNNPETSIAPYQFSQGRAYMPSLKVGNTEITGNLTVDGNIIHGSGGGIFNGDQAITVAGGATLAFTLTRATTGTMVFDVWLTSESSTGSSVAKKYTVAHSYNTTPVYNKIIDTGPRGSADFTVAFADSNTGATGTSVVCNLTAVSDNQNIGYTVQVGHDSTNALTFTAAS